MLACFLGLVPWPSPTLFMGRMSQALLETYNSRVYKQVERNGRYITDVPDGVTPVNSYVRTTEMRTRRLAPSESSKNSKDSPCTYLLLCLALYPWRYAEVARRFVEITASTGFAPAHLVLFAKDAASGERSGRSVCTVMHRKKSKTGFSEQDL